MSKNARIYKRVSTEEQNLSRQNSLINEAKANGYYIAAIYEEKASGINPDRPELNRMINELQEGDVIIADNIDRISRLPPLEAEKLMQRIKDKKATIRVPGYIDLTEFKTGNEMADLLLDNMTQLLLKLLLLSANQNYKNIKHNQKQGIENAKKQGKYKGRSPNLKNHAEILKLRNQGVSIKNTAEILGCSTALVKLVTKKNKNLRID